MRLIHLTDPHLSVPPDWRDLGGRSHWGKRYLGYLSWSRGRRHYLRRQWLDELTDEVLGCKPEQILISGDLTQIGVQEEIDQAGNWLKNLAPAQQILFTPGNHDIYSRDSWPEIRRAWADFLPCDGQYPLVRRFESVQLHALCSALPTRPLSACGLLGQMQLDRLARSLQQSVPAFNLLMLHHPPLPGMSGYRKRLRDASMLEKVLSDCPVEIILHGHRHRNLSEQRGNTRIFCTAPASSSEASFRVFDIDPIESGWQVRMRLQQRGSDGFSCVEELCWKVSARA